MPFPEDKFQGNNVFTKYGDIKLRKIGLGVNGRTDTGRPDGMPENVMPFGLLPPTVGGGGTKMNRDYCSKIYYLLELVISVLDNMMESGASFLGGGTATDTEAASKRSRDFGLSVST